MTEAEFYEFHRRKLASRGETLSYFHELLADAPDVTCRPIIAELIDHNVTTIFDHSESPIESLFFATLAQGLMMYGRVGVFRRPSKNAPLDIAAARMRFKALPDEIEMAIEQVGVNLTMQAKFPDQGFRVDLLAWRSCDSSAPLVVECDGFDYHSDRAAFTRDRQRDRTLQSLGYRVVRFSGSEIHREPIRVAAEVMKILYPPKNQDIQDSSPLKTSQALKIRKLSLLEDLKASLEVGSDEWRLTSESLSRIGAE